MAPQNKYKLASGDRSDTAPCAFFLSPQGCRNGANCKFAHIAPAAPVESPPVAAKQARAIVETGSVVSSESESEGEIPNQGAVDAGKKRTRRGQANDSPFVKPKKAKTVAIETPTPATTTAIPGRTETSTTKISAKSAVPPKASVVVVPPAAEAPSQPPVPAQPPIPSFRSLNLPIAKFSLRSSTENARFPTPTAPDDPFLTAPLPTRTETGRKWLQAVEMTRAHPKYRSEFNYERYIASDEAQGGKNIWIKARPFGDWCLANPQAIAMDCEMCETTDPVTGEKDYKALCRISIVDAETDEVLLDTLVKPAWPVTDHRARINGITKELLQDVKFTIQHAQEFMMALCSDQTVIMGHSVNNDLAAIRMEHYCVADSACLFKAVDSETATLGLKDLAMHILGKSMPDTHDSVNDTRVALRCLEYFIQKKGNVERVARLPRTPKKRKKEEKKDDASELFIHKLPKYVKREHLSQVFIDHTGVTPLKVSHIDFSGEHGKATVQFQSKKHANLAFSTLEGGAKEDSSGRLQKKLYLRRGDYVRVRKMVVEEKKDHKRGHHQSKGRRRD